MNVQIETPIDIIDLDQEVKIKEIEIIKVETKQERIKNMIRIIKIKIVKMIHGIKTLKMIIIMIGIYQLRKKMRNLKDHGEIIKYYKD